MLNASLYQAETIKTRLEQQMDNLDVTDTHYDKKISDLQRRLDTQYDRIDEVEETMAELKSQIYELKKNQIDADSIYGFLGAFNEVYSECTDAEKKQFMQAFIERIDIFPERREDGNWIQFTTAFSLLYLHATEKASGLGNSLHFVKICD